MLIYLVLTLIYADTTPNYQVVYPMSDPYACALRVAHQFEKPMPREWNSHPVAAYEATCRAAFKPDAQPTN